MLDLADIEWAIKEIRMDLDILERLVKFRHFDMSDLHSEAMFFIETLTETTSRVRA